MINSREANNLYWANLVQWFIHESEGEMPLVADILYRNANESGIVAITKKTIYDSINIGKYNKDKSSMEDIGRALGYLKSAGFIDIIRDGIELVIIIREYYAHRKVSGG